MKFVRLGTFVKKFNKYTLDKIGARSKRSTWYVGGLFNGEYKPISLWKTEKLFWKEGEKSRMSFVSSGVIWAYSKANVDAPLLNLVSFTLMSGLGIQVGCTYSGLGS